MDDEIEVIVAAASTVKDQIAKVVLGALAGFAAGKMTERVYDVAMSKFRNR